MYIWKQRSHIFNTVGFKKMMYCFFNRNTLIINIYLHLTVSFSVILVFYDNTRNRFCNVWSNTVYFTRLWRMDRRRVCIIITKNYSNVKSKKSKWTVVENNISISDNDSFFEYFSWSNYNTGFIEFDHPDRIWSPHNSLRMIPYSLNN